MSSFLMASDLVTPRPLPEWLAGVLVVFTSGAVLVLEILGIRLLAPYVGATLRVYTSIVGVVLAGIALGTWAGGGLADRFSPERMLGPTLIAGGVAVLFVLPMVRLTAAGTSTDDIYTVVLLTVVAMLIPALVLSAISPMVIKLQLKSLSSTGSVVGRLSALGTAGAIVGTFLTGFVLIGAFSVSTILISLGVVLIISGLITIGAYGFARKSVPNIGMVMILMAAPGALATNFIGTGCDEETSYYCVRLVQDSENASGTFLELDNQTHSYIDSNDDSYLRFWYTRSFALVADTTKPDTRLDTLSVGGGGMSMPRYFGATRNSGTNTVLELDRELVAINERQLSLDVDESRIEISFGDARTSISEVEDRSQDFVLVDAFGQEAVPWHLTTEEFWNELERTMRSDAVAVMNVIDYTPNSLLKAELATMKQVFSNVILFEQRSSGGNWTLIGSNGPIDAESLSAAVEDSELEGQIISGAELSDFIENAPVLTDNFAPVDQLISPARSITYS